jgi:hypothetical protein
MSASFRLTLSFAVVASSMVLPVAAVAQDEAIPIEQRRFIRNNTGTVGIRHLGGGKVEFGGVAGALPPATDFGPATGGAITRFYDDGGVGLDSTGNEGGLSRNWTYLFDSQVTPEGNIAFNSYRTESQGYSAVRDTDANIGWELGFTRRLGSLGPQTEWGLAGGIGLNDIKAQAAETILARLVRVTDVYSLGGQTPPPAPYSAPSFIVDSDGNLVETTVPIGAEPLVRTQTEFFNGAEVQGNWRLKGAYFTARLGPMVRAQFGSRFSLYGSAGYAATLAGATLSLEERVQLEEVRTSPALVTERQDSKLISGFYAEANAEFWLTEVTGFYAGVSYFQRGSFDVEASGRTARVTLDNSTGVQMGVVFRF